MDVMRVDTRDGHHRYAMCTACYGYMGDLMHTSEGLRWLGPSRYNLAGAHCAPDALLPVRPALHLSAVRAWRVVRRCAHGTLC